MDIINIITFAHIIDAILLQCALSPPPQGSLCNKVQDSIKGHVGVGIIVKMVVVVQQEEGHKKIT